MNQNEKDRLQAIADSIDAMTCILSVEKLPDGGCGTIRTSAAAKEKRVPPAPIFL